MSPRHRAATVEGKFQGRFYLAAAEMLPVVGRSWKVVAFLECEEEVEGAVARLEALSRCWAVAVVPPTGY